MTFLLKALFNYTISAIMCVNKKAIDRNKLRLWPFFTLPHHPSAHAKHLLRAYC